MPFTIRGLSPEPFRPLFGRPDDELARFGAIRYVVDAKPGFPCRITLADAEIGETVLLLNHTYLDEVSPYRGAHGIFVRESADAAVVFADEIPAVLATRQLSVRALDTSHLMVDADVIDGTDAKETIERFFTDPKIAYLLAHNAKRGCFAARVERRYCAPRRDVTHSRHSSESSGTSSSAMRSWWLK